MIGRNKQKNKNYASPLQSSKSPISGVFYRLVFRIWNFLHRSFPGKLRFFLFIFPTRQFFSAKKEEKEGQEGLGGREVGVWNSNHECGLCDPTELLLHPCN